MVSRSPVAKVNAVYPELDEMGQINVQVIPCFGELALEMWHHHSYIVAFPVVRRQSGHANLGFALMANFRTAFSHPSLALLAV